MDQYDNSARLTFHLALEEANLVGSPLLPEHLLLALVRSNETIRKLLVKSPGDLDILRKIASSIDIEDGVTDMERASHVSEEVRRIIKTGVTIAQQKNLKLATNENLAEALLSSQDRRLVRFFEQAGIEPAAVKKDLLKYR